MLIGCGMAALMLASSVSMTGCDKEKESSEVADVLEPGSASAVIYSNTSGY